MKNKLLTYLTVAVLALSVVYIGNRVLNSTPKSAASDNKQYKVVLVGEPNSGDNYNEAKGEIMEKLLNQNAQDGWAMVSADLPYLVFEK